MPKPLCLLLLALTAVSQAALAQDISVRESYPIPALPSEGFAASVFEVQRLRNEDMRGAIRTEERRGNIPTNHYRSVSLKDNRPHIYRLNTHIVPFNPIDDPLYFSPAEGLQNGVRLNTDSMRWGRSVVGLTTNRGSIMSRVSQFDRILDRPSGRWRWSSSAPADVQVVEHVDPKLLPYSWIGYDLLQVMVIEDFPYAELDPLQEDAIARWIERGGTLLVSPGNSGAALQSNLVRSLTGLQLSGSTKTTYRTFQGVTRWNFEIKGAKDIDYAKVARCGAGQVVVFHYDILREPFTRGNSLNTMLATMPRITAGSSVRYTEYPIDWRREEEKLPSPLTIAMILGIYIVVVGPANYLFLRSRKRLVLMPFSIVGIAVAFTISIIAYGYISRGTSTELKEMAIIQTYPDRANAFVRQQIGIYASSNRSFTLEFNRDTALRRVADEDELRSSSSSPLNVDHLGEKLEARFSTLMWKAYKIEAQDYLSQFGNLTYTINNNTVTIYNNTELPLSDCWVKHNNRWYVAGDLPAKGQSTLSLNRPFAPPMYRHGNLTTTIIGKVARDYTPISYDMTEGSARTVQSETYLFGGVR